MYAKSLMVENFKCFGQAKLKLQYPGRRGRDLPELRNVNLILGDNGGGKSSILRAISLAMLAPTLLESGFVPYRLVRRVTGGSTIDEAKVTIEGVASENEGAPAGSTVKLSAMLEMRGHGDLDRLTSISAGSLVAESIFDAASPGFFVMGYGATRRLEVGDYSESSARRTRGLRYARVASLFEDHVALRPLSSWAGKLESIDPQRYADAVKKINEVLPDNISFSGKFDREEGQGLFLFNGVVTPMSALSDGYKSFIGWVADLIGQLSDLDAGGRKIDQIPGVVLLDEIDLHLHPEWQRKVIPCLAKAFPKLQFVFTSHSPLVASTVHSKNVFVTAIAADGSATIGQLEERLYGRSIEELLLSSYFGLTTTRPEAFQEQGRSLFLQAAMGDSEAALRYLNLLSGAAAPSDNVMPMVSGE